MTAALAAFAMVALILRFPDLATNAAREALCVWGRDIVPSLFPYMVLCKMLAARLKNSAIPSAPLAVTLGLLGGSPSGAAMLSASAEGMSRRRCAAFSALTGTISPMFFLGTLHAWGISQSLCVRLLAAHWLGAGFACACVWYAYSAREDRTVYSSVQDGRMANPVVDSVQAVLGVGGCIVFFSVAASCVAVVFPFLSAWGHACFQAALEIAGGMRALSMLGAADSRTVVCMAVLTGFGGFSILTQNRLFLQTCGITQGQLFGFALLRAFGSGAAMALMVQFM